MLVCIHFCIVFLGDFKLLFGIYHQLCLLLYEFFPSVVTIKNKI